MWWPLVGPWRGPFRKKEGPELYRGQRNSGRALAGKSPSLSRVWRLPASKEGYWGRSKRGRGKWRNSCAIVTQWCQWCPTIAQLLRNSCASKPWKTRGSAWQPALYGNYCVAFRELLRNCCATIASLPVTPFTLPPPSLKKRRTDRNPSFKKKGVLKKKGDEHFCVFGSSRMHFGTSSSRWREPSQKTMSIQKFQDPESCLTYVGTSL